MNEIEKHFLWKGRKDMEPDVIINSDKVPTLTTAELKEKLPVLIGQMDIRADY